MIQARDLEFPVQSLMEVTERPEIVFAKGQGAWLTDHRGKRYLDFVPGWEDTGLLLNSPRPDAIRLMPALNVTGAEIDRMIEGLRIAIDAVR